MRDWMFRLENRETMPLFGLFVEVRHFWGPWKRNAVPEDIWSFGRDDVALHSQLSASGYRRP